VHYTLCLIPGDGIGPEVTAAAQEVLESTGLNLSWIVLPAGARALEDYGNVLPESTVKNIKRYKVALKGPVTTPIGTGFKSVNVQLRESLNLYCCLRPVRNLPGVKSHYSNIDIVIFRENTEGLYSGQENEIVDGVVTSLKVVTRAASERIARKAFLWAKENGRKKVSVFHKANIMKKTDGLWLEVAREIHQQIAPELQYEELLIDNACMQLVRNPNRFDVLLCQNLDGDIVSDLCAGLVGGLGVAPGANLGDECAVFEAVHGSAPDLAGKNIANPLAVIMSGELMLRHLGENVAADRLRRAYESVLLEGRPEELTYDLGGTGTTQGFAHAVIKRLQNEG
jgi:isocitrate dehydrogenase (NAD+)